MNRKTVKIGNHYRLNKDTYCWAKVLSILNPKEGINTTNKILAKCVWSTDKNTKFGLIKYFALRDLTEAKK